MRHRANKLEVYVKVIRSIRDMEDDENDPKNPLNCLTSPAFWYYIGAEYFYFSHFNYHRRKEIKAEIVRKTSVMVNSITIPCRFERRRANRNSYERLRACETLDSRQ
jgi:hypothetical protein